MNYSEKREWEQMEGKILALEKEIEEIQSQIHNPLISSQPEQLQQACQTLDEKQKALENLFERWQELESKL
jgi:ATP-binding cassette subfamily F protein uup